MNPSFLLLSILPFLFLLPSQVASISPLNNDGPSMKKQNFGPFSVDLESINGKYYTTNLTFGVGIQMEMRMLIDSNTSDIWVASTWCTGPPAECGKRKFDCSPDTGCSETNRDDYLTYFGYKRMKICYEYPLGCVIATVAQVFVKFTGTTTGIEETTIGMLKSSTGIFGTDPYFDGILGMGRPEDLFVTDVKSPPPPGTQFENLLPADPDKKKYFVYLRSGKGKLDLGAPVGKHYSWWLKEYPGASPVYWMLLAAKIKYETQKFRNQACQFVTSYPYIGMPRVIYNQLFLTPENEAGQASTVPCLSGNGNLPDLLITFGTDTYRIPDKIYISSKPDAEGKCLRLIVPTEHDYWILGIPWFERFYTGFDFTQNKISIAKAK